MKAEAPPFPNSNVTGWYVQKCTNTEAMILFLPLPVNQLINQFSAQ